MDTYIDRAMKGTNDLCPDFQRMLKDSAKKQWNYVLVYNQMLYCIEKSSEEPPKSYESSRFFVFFCSRILRIRKLSWGKNTKIAYDFCVSCIF